MAALLYVLLFGTAMMGARRWISLGLLQSAALRVRAHGWARPGAREGLRREPPGESHAGGPGDRGRHWRCLPIVLIVQAARPRHGRHGDSRVSGHRLRGGAADARSRDPAAVVAVLAMPVAWKFVLQDYQRPACSTFLDPVEGPAWRGLSTDPGPHHHGSGGLVGKGFTKGTQGSCGSFRSLTTTSSFRSGEEQGFVGVIRGARTLLFVVIRSLEAARLAKDRLGAYLVVGSWPGFTFQVLYNISMSAGLAPVKGLTLPLMSYGGSSLIATLAGFGLILNVRMRRFTN